MNCTSIQLQFQLRLRVYKLDIFLLYQSTNQIKIYSWFQYAQSYVGAKLFILSNGDVQRNSERCQYFLVPINRLSLIIHL